MIRELSSLKQKDETILELEEQVLWLWLNNVLAPAFLQYAYNKICSQIRDLTVYLEAQKTLGNLTDEAGIKGGTLLPVPLEQPSPANRRKATKANRRRK